VEEPKDPQDANKGGHNTDKNTEQPASHPPPLTGDYASNVKNGNAEAPQHSSNCPRQNRFWDVSFLTITQLVAAIVLAAVGYLQYTVYDRQAGIMRGQLDQMQTEQRPWIKVEVTPDWFTVYVLPTEKDGPRG
jgi:hypothetical protein